MGTQGAPADDWFRYRFQDISCFRAAADDQMRVDRNRPVITSVRREAHRAVREGEHRTAVRQVEEVEMSGTDRHLQRETLLVDIHEANAQALGIAIGSEKITNSLRVHAGDGTPGGL